MANYRLHIEYDRSEKLVDLEGAEFVDLQSAVAEARLALREMIADCIMSGTEPPIAISIEDAQGNTVAKVTRREMLPTNWIQAA